MVHSSVLRQLEFDALLEWLAPSREAAGEKYELIRHRLLRYFEGHHCVPPDEHVDETLDRVARRVAGGERIESPDPIRYCYGVAKNVLLEYRKHQATVSHNGDQVSTADPTPSLEPSCLNCCLRALSPRQRELLEAYYLDHRGGLAARNGVTANALRLRVFKAKNKLRACLVRCIRQQGISQGELRKYLTAKRH